VRAQDLVNAIVRPPRAEYDPDDGSLGPVAFTFCGAMFTRTDFALDTVRGMTLHCSHWEPVERVAPAIPCVIYMHGNSSARVEAVGCLSYLLSLGVSVFAFDFSGSGMSAGEYVQGGRSERRAKRAASEGSAPPLSSPPPPDRAKVEGLGPSEGLGSSEGLGPFEGLGPCERLVPRVVWSLARPGPSLGLVPRSAWSLAWPGPSLGLVPRSAWSLARPGPALGLVSRSAWVELPA
jgi:hypothetical protein